MKITVTVEMDGSDTRGHQILRHLVGEGVAISGGSPLPPSALPPDDALSPPSMGDASLPAPVAGSEMPAVDLTKKPNPEAQKVWEKFVARVIEGRARAEKPSDQEEDPLDLSNLLRGLANHRKVWGVLQYVAYVGGLQRAIYEAFPLTPEEADQIAADIQGPASILFFDLANLYDYTDRWKRSLP